MPKPELYVIYTGNKGRKPDTISLSQEFFDGADIDIEIKAVEEISAFFPELTSDDVEEIEKAVMQLS